MGQHLNHLFQNALEKCPVVKYVYTRPINDIADEQICSMLRTHPEGESAQGLIAALGVPDSKVRLRLNALIKNRRIEMQGRGASLRYVLVPPREAAGS